MISNDDAIRGVYYGENGILSSLMPGSVIIDSSTISPARSSACSDAAAKFADFLDAPVTGSKPAAEGGTLVFMVGGDADVIHKVSDILLAMGRKVIPMGPSGSGATAKLAHNTIVGINIAALVEGMAIAASGGIDAAAFLELVQSGGAGSKIAELKPRKLLDRDFSVQFSLELMLKDLRLSSVLSDHLKRQPRSRDGQEPVPDGRLHGPWSTLISPLWLTATSNGSTNELPTAACITRLLLPRKPRLDFRK